MWCYVVTQEDVFRACGVGNIVLDCVREGRSGSVIAYGQTGSGSLPRV